MGKHCFDRSHIHCYYQYDICISENITYTCIRTYKTPKPKLVSHHLLSFWDIWSSLFCLKMTCRSRSWSRGQRKRCLWLHCHGSCFHIRCCHHCGRTELCGPLLEAALHSTHYCCHCHGRCCSVEAAWVL